MTVIKNNNLNNNNNQNQNLMPSKDKELELVENYIVYFRIKAKHFMNQWFFIFFEQTFDYKFKGLFQIHENLKI